MMFFLVAGLINHGQRITSFSQTLTYIRYLCFLFCRQECKKLREELKEEHEEDKASALSQLAQSKEQELSSARESWQRKVEDLLEQVLQLDLHRCTKGCFSIFMCFIVFHTIYAPI